METERENCLAQAALRGLAVPGNSAANRQPPNSQRGAKVTAVKCESQTSPGLLARGWLLLERFVTPDKVTFKTLRGNSVLSLAQNWDSPSLDARRSY